MESSGFPLTNPSGRIMALRSTQPLTEMSTRVISWRVKAAGSWGWQLTIFMCRRSTSSGSLSLVQPSRPAQACIGIAVPSLLPLPFTVKRCFHTLQSFVIFWFHAGTYIFWTESKPLFSDLNPVSISPLRFWHPARIQWVLHREQCVLPLHTSRFLL